MKRKNKIFASLAAILLLFESASGTVASAQTVDPQVESSNCLLYTSPSPRD